ncbi:MAG: hypothetical protein MJ202_07625 [Lentisphaeria bacterium]|nr:hypothetical protein [Lentisphaeria bacterium]
MRKQILFAAVFALLCTFSAFGIDKLAIAEPSVKSGIQKEEGDMLWGMLEEMVASKGASKYALVSRAALQQMMTEIGLTTSSDLVNLNSVQRAKLGQLDTVKYLLISEIGKFGSKVNCTMRIMESSTGVIDPMRTVTLRCKDLDELGDQLEWAVEKLCSDKKAMDRSALLNSIVTAPNAPAYLANEFNTILESSLLANNVSLQNLKSVSAYLAKNGIASLEECEPRTYVKIGKDLEVKNLLRASIDRFEIVSQQFQVPETGYTGVIFTGVMSGTLRVINTSTGETLVVQPFEARANFNGLDPMATATWTTEDYGKFLIRSVVCENILPGLFQNLAAKQQQKGE